MPTCTPCNLSEPDAVVFFLEATTTSSLFLDLENPSRSLQAEKHMDCTIASNGTTRDVNQLLNITIDLFKNPIL